MTDTVEETRHVVAGAEGTEEQWDPVLWKSIGAELLGRRFDTLRHRLAEEPGSEKSGTMELAKVDEAIEVIQKMKVDDVAETKGWSDDTLAHAFDSAATHPQRALLLATYLYAKQLEAWENASDWDNIRKLINVTTTTLEKHLTGLEKRDLVEAQSDPVAALLRSLVKLMEAIDPAMEVESELNCSCPEAMAIAASKVAKKAAAIQHELNPVKPEAEGLEACWAFVYSRAKIDEIYFTAIGVVCKAVKAYINGSKSAVTKMLSHIDTIKNAERLLKGDVYASELRSHRFALDALSRAWPRLRVDQATVTYCYPFAMAWAAPENVLVAAKDVGATWDFSGEEVKVTSLQLTDMWNEDPADVDPQSEGPEHRKPENRKSEKGTTEHGKPDKSESPTGDRYTGLRFSFLRGPRVYTSTANECLSFTLEIRLTSLGNHHLLLKQELEDVSIHQLNQAMRRAMPEMGIEEVIFGSDEEDFWGMANLAEKLIDKLVAHLEPRIRWYESQQDQKRHHHHHHHKKRPENEQSKPPHESPEKHSEKSVKTDGTSGLKRPGEARHANPHVILTARRLSRENVGPIVTETDLPPEMLWSGVRGSALLVQPVRQAAAVLEEWCRYDLPDVHNVNSMQPFGFHENFAYRTTNTTFGLLRGTPEFLIREHEETAEFVASLPILLESWVSEIRRHANHHELRDHGSPSAISDRQLELRELLTNATTVIAKIRSSDLCRTAVHRELLDQLFKIAGVERFEQELQSQFQVVDAHLNTLSARAAQREQKRLDKQAFYFGAGAVLIGVPSLAALLQLVDAGDGITRGPWDLGEGLALVVGLGILVGIVLSAPGAEDLLNTLKKPFRWLRRTFSRLFGDKQVKTGGGAPEMNPKSNAHE